MNKQVIVIAIVIILFVSAVVGASFLLAGKGQQQPQDHTTHDESTFNSWIGKEAPNFTIDSFQGGKVSLDQLRGKKVLLFFTEGVMCYPACWNQMAELASDPRLNTDAIRTYSIVVDVAKNWGSAISQMPDLAKADVLYDTDSTVSKMYGMLKSTSSMHYGVYPGHAYVIVDSSGIVRYILDDPRMAINNDKLVVEIQNIQTSTTSTAK